MLLPFLAPHGEYLAVSHGLHASCRCHERCCQQLSDQHSLELQRNAPNAGWSRRHPELAVPMALHRPQIGPPARHGSKTAKKWTLARPEKKKKGGGGGEKMAKKWENGHFWPIFEERGKNGQKKGKMAIFVTRFLPPICPFLGHFSPFFPVGPILSMPIART